MRESLWACHGACRSLFTSSRSFQFDFFSARAGPLPQKLGGSLQSMHGPSLTPGMASVNLTIKPVQARLHDITRLRDGCQVCIRRRHCQAPAGANAGEFQVSIDTTATIEELKEKAGCVASHGSTAQT